MSLRVVMPVNDGQELNIPQSNPKHSNFQLGRRQQMKRIRKIKRGFRGLQHNWLLWWVSPYQPQEDFSEWLTGHMSSIRHLLPQSIYQYAIENFVISEKRVPENKKGIFVWEIDEVHRIVVLSALGIVAFLAPSGCFRKSIDPKGKCTSWNLSIDGAPFSAVQGILHDRPKKASYVDMLQRKYGRGKGATVAIIDSGILPDSPEFSGRVLGAWAVRHDRYGEPRPDFGCNYDETGHGTAAASIAVGRDFGVAPEAKILSIQMPMERSRYRLFDLASAFNMLISGQTPAINGFPCIDLIDTILLPNGIHLKSKRGANLDLANITMMLAKFSRFHNIIIVAAVGNTSDSVAFPADDPNVMSVGALESDTPKRLEGSGWGKDVTGRDVPIVHFPGLDVACVGLNGRPNLISGTSAAAAGIAGLVSLFARNGRSGQSRWQRMRNNIVVHSDGFGPLPIFPLTD